MATLDRVDKYADFATTKLYFLPTIADAGLAYTRAELTAGTEISADLAELEGWTVSAGEIETPSFGDDFNAKIPGKTEAEDSSLTFWADKTGQDVRTVFTRGESGYIVWLDGGDVVDNISAVFPVRVRSVSVMRSAGDDAARVQVQFSITAKPNENVAVPATV